MFINLTQSYLLFAVSWYCSQDLRISFTFEKPAQLLSLPFVLSFNILYVSLAEAYATAASSCIFCSLILHLFLCVLYLVMRDMSRLLIYAFQFLKHCPSFLF